MLYRTFFLQITVTENIGDVQKVRVSFLTPEQPASWYLERLRFQDEHTKDEFTIEVRDWVKETDTQDAVREYPVLWPGMDAPKGELNTFIYSFIVNFIHYKSHSRIFLFAPKRWRMVSVNKISVNPAI